MRLQGKGKKICERARADARAPAAALALALLLFAAPAAARPVGQAGDRGEAEVATMGIVEKVVQTVKEWWAPGSRQKPGAAPANKPGPASAQAQNPASAQRSSGAPAQSQGAAPPSSQAAAAASPAGAPAAAPAGGASSSASAPAQNNSPGSANAPAGQASAPANSGQASSSGNGGKASGNGALGAADPAKVAAALRKIGDVPAVARLAVPREERLSSNRYGLSGAAANSFERFVMHPVESPEVADAKAIATLAKRPASTEAPREFRYIQTSPKGVFSRKPIDEVSIALTPEKPFAPNRHVALTTDEFRFLSGLLLYQRGDNCGVAVGLFHAFSKSRGAAGQANYYLALCARQLGLEGEFLERARRAIDSGSQRYASRIIKELPADLPEDFIVPIGAALFKNLGAKGNLKIVLEDPKVAGNASYWLAQYGTIAGKYKTAIVSASQVPEGHPKSAQAKFLLALAEYEAGDKAKALRIEEDLVTKADAAPGSDREFVGTAALNLARMQFQEQMFKQANLNFLKVYKDHPLWLQSLVEMGWAQLRGGDSEGAVGNMYSVQSPYFKAVYKPESYVIRTIGYLNICQYGDAYRTLTRLERQYRPFLEKMDAYSARKESRSSSVRKFVSAAAKADADFDGLPSPVLREMARHKDFINQQKALNARLDERGHYARLTIETDRKLAQARAAVMASRKRIADIKARIVAVPRGPQMETRRAEYRSELSREFEALNDRFFEIDMLDQAKTAIFSFSSETVAAADARVATLKSGIERALSSRLERMRADLRQILENNELLRYEVFAGSGENIRFQIAGGEKSNRVPASVLPQSKSLRWDFDGEYWEDEVGHFRSSLRNNCPDSAIRGQARIEGDDE